MNNNLGGFTPVIDDTGKITGYKTTLGGADTVFPFSSKSCSFLFCSTSSNNTAKFGSINFNDNNNIILSAVTFGIKVTFKKVGKYRVRWGKGNYDITRAITASGLISSTSGSYNSEVTVDTEGQYITFTLASSTNNGATFSLVVITEE